MSRIAYDAFDLCEYVGNIYTRPYRCRGTCRDRRGYYRISGPVRGIIRTGIRTLTKLISSGRNARASPTRPGMLTTITIKIRGLIPIGSKTIEAGWIAGIRARNPSVHSKMTLVVGGKDLKDEGLSWLVF